VYTVVSAIVARLGERSATLRVGGISALLTGLTIVLVLISPSTVAAVAFVLLRAPPWSTMDTIIYPLAAAGAHRSALGRGSVMGLVMLGWAAASTVGPILAGAIADSAGDRAAYAVMLAFCVLIGLWLLHAARRAEASPAAVDLDRLYGAPDLDALRGEYDRIAGLYDSGVGADMEYASPRAVAEVARRLLEPEAAVLDAGAGTGLLGVELARAGFERLDALDMSGGMLGQAERKGVYRDLRLGTLGDRLDYETASYDGVVCAGVLTTGHAPSRSLDELVRVTRPGGHVIFTLRSDTALPGFDDKMVELERAGRWALVDRGDEFQALPKGEPGVLVRVWAFRVLEPVPAD
jgi:SAM-dependent methyltransferase